ncbi:MAG: di-trans,poly-cis-decaprenylcistransferase [Clostridiales bacterium]|jgi:undecaprenyl diphosphate synthase|nr:di-trans,poly-cis-decaprenylcistransferase [Clostridiales bacterium]
MLQLPKHVGIIMDGNGRWAKKRGLPKKIGHKKGASTLEKIVLHSEKLGLNMLTVYAFSTENWNRPKIEIDDLFALLKDGLENIEQKISGKNIKVCVIGDIGFLNNEIKESIWKIENITKNNTGMKLNIAANYGSRNEILQSFKKILKDVLDKKIESNRITENTISNNLYVPDVDLIIMPASRQRLSNFLLWQASYAEFWISDVLWPDFSKKDLEDAISFFNQTKRNFGGSRE